MARIHAMSDMHGDAEAFVCAMSVVGLDGTVQNSGQVPVLARLAGHQAMNLWDLASHDFEVLSWPSHILPRNMGEK